MPSQPNPSRNRKIAGYLLILLIASFFELNQYMQSLRGDYFGLFLGSNNQNATNDASNDLSGDDRTIYGYRHPRPPFQPIRHIPHNCSTFQGGKEREVYLPVSVPHLILIGVQKSGTSTLQDVVDRIPQFVTPSFRRKFEPHFFDFDGVKADNTTDEGRLCAYREDYSKFFDQRKIKPNVSVVFEKTPAYILFPKIALAIDAVCTWKPKLLAIIRNPASRAFSQFQMEIGGKKTTERDLNQKLISLIDKEVQSFIKNGLLEGPYIDTDISVDNEYEGVDMAGTLSIGQFLQRNWTKGTSPFRYPTNATLDYYAERVRNYSGNRKGHLFRGLYAPLLVPWVEQFAEEDRLMVIHFEEFAKAENEGRKDFVNEILGFAGVVINGTAGDQAGKPASQVQVPSNSTKVVPDKFLTGGDVSNIHLSGNETTRRRLQTTLHSVSFGNATRRLQRRRRRKLRRLVWSFKKNYAPMPPKVKEYLTLLFRPFNDLLPELLGEEWRGVWD